MFFCPTPLAVAALFVLATSVKAADKAPGKAPEGMVWIPGGEFAMGAATNGHGSAEMAMPSNDAAPIPCRA